MCSSLTSVSGPSDRFSQAFFSTFVTLSGAVEGGILVFDSPPVLSQLHIQGVVRLVTARTIVMATMFGRFEIQSELSKSETALIYKAMDTETNQVVALKTQSLESLGDGADAFVETLIAEGEATRDLVSPNIVPLLVCFWRFSIR